MNDQLAKITIFRNGDVGPTKTFVPLSRSLRDGLARVLPASVAPIVILLPTGQRGKSVSIPDTGIPDGALSGWGVQLLPISRLLSPSTGTPVSKMAGPLSMPESRPFGLHCLHSAHPWINRHWAPPLPLAL